VTNADRFYRMQPLEVAGGWLPGIASEIAAPPRRSTESPLEALEQVLLPVLQMSPCVISFSGGRDSSAVLAAAVHVARKASLPLPVAVTKIYPGIPEADETEWQELVIRHLGVTEWVRRDFDDELDLVGPTGAESLRRHGLLWPPTIHTNSPFLELARGGAYLTGEGGDEIMGAHRITPLTQAVAEPRTLGRAAMKQILKAVAPTAARQYLLSRRNRIKTDRVWLRPAAKTEFDRTLLRETLDEPLPWSSSVRRIIRHRTPTYAMWNFRVLAAANGVTVLHPLREPRFVAALVSRGGANRVLGFASRTQAMRAVFADLLPDAILARETKAYFNRPYFGKYSQEFTRSWTGKGADPDLVDEDALRQVWATDVPHGGTYALLHAAWLADNGLPEAPVADHPG
jgi:asparagine synthetase B (glutamine-hydrolysing)